jgi:hypothetical protein
MPSGAPFDPTNAVRFDLSRGSVHALDEERVVLLPSSALAALAKGAPAPVVEEVGRKIGASMGRRLAARLGATDAVRDASLVTLVGHLAGEIALAGWGTVSIERWGKALVVLLEGAELPDALVVPAMEALLTVASGRSLSCLALVHDAGAIRILVSSERAVARAMEWILEGIGWGEVLTRLNDTATGATRGDA